MEKIVFEHNPIAGYLEYEIAKAFEEPFFTEVTWGMPACAYYYF